MNRDDVDPADAVKPREGEDVLAWIMRSRAMTFPEAVRFANELLRDGGDGE